MKENEITMIEISFDIDGTSEIKVNNIKDT